MAGTLRPSKLEALLGSERVGLERDGQAQRGVRIRDSPQQQAPLPAKVQDPTLGSWRKEGRVLSVPGGAGHRVPSALQVPIKV